MKFFIERTPDTGSELLANLRRRYLQIIVTLALIVLVVTNVIDVIRQSVGDDFPLLVALTLLAVGVLALIQLGYVRLAGLLFQALLVGVAFFYTDIRGLVPATLAVITAAVLLQRYLYVIVSLLVIGSRLIPLFALLSTGSGDHWTTFGPLVTIIIVGVTMRYFVQALERTVERANHTAAILQTTTEVGQIATSILGLQELFNRSVELIQERFGFYHVQVFMVNGDVAELVSSTGEAGRQLLARNHRLPVGSNSVIGRVTSTGEPVVTRDTDTDSGHYYNPLLPETRAELAVPIHDGEKIIGALDMQSQQPDIFTPEDIQVLQTLANVLAVSIRNARLFDEQEKAVEEQQRLYLESEANLREIRRLNRQLTRIGWEDYIESTPDTTGVTLRGDQLTTGAEWTPALLEALRQGDVVVQAANGKPGVVAVPLRLRGETIGAIEVEIDEAQPESAETIEAVAQRLVSSLDNARLFEESQAATLQEQRINTIVARYQSASTVDDLLQITLSELGEALGARRGAIRLGRLPADDTDGEASQ